MSEQARAYPQQSSLSGLPPLAGSPPPLVAFQGVLKRFGGTEALKRVSFEVEAGEILALLGENGAGKSTLIKCLAGIYTPDAGDILYRGQPYQHKPPRYGERQPVAFIHQDLGLVEWMTIAENMALAIGYPKQSVWRGIDWRQTEALAARALELVGCDIDPAERIQNLSRTEKSLVAIARALAVECDVLVLDEPTASLPADEVHRLFDAIRPLKARGVGMIYVSHRLDEIFEIADRAVVMRDGTFIGSRRVDATTPDELVEMIVGRMPETTVPSAPEDGAERLAVRGMTVGPVGPVDFTVQSGEVVGLVGLRGAGQERIGRALFGAVAFEGAMILDGENLRPRTPGEAIAAGIGLIARDRTEESIFAGLSIRENAYSNPGAIGRSLSSVMTPAAEGENARRLGERVGLRPNNPDLPIEALSGGNQQKVIVGRWLGIARRLLIAEDPTAGVDVGAKAEIYRLIEQARQQGLVVIVVSTDFEEITRICHRALVFGHGQVVAELKGAEITMAALVHAASTAGAQRPHETGNGSAAA